MNLIIALIILGVVQGIAEFLPVSSSGHLVICEHIPFIRDILNTFGEDIGLFINVALHVATLIAVLIYLRSDIFKIITCFFSAVSKKEFKSSGFLLPLYIIVASIPAGFAGIFLNDYLEVLFGSLLAVGILLVINGFILSSTRFIKIKDNDLEQTGFIRALIIGLFQALAIIPGISRSGMTISGGLLTGLKPNDAARFSFLMAIPVIAGAGLIEGIKISGKNLGLDFYAILFLAMILTVIVALFAMKLLFYFVKKVRVDIFGYYTALVGICCIVIAAV
ncbi:MAG: undecaprenyl-diphosphate phosphatase [Spirochaetes bacterium]|nr:undecaprenyl-diphosphate phosphatase [Spirochaetota bacterium]